MKLQSLPPWLYWRQ
jgi:hypothetical protein